MSLYLSFWRKTQKMKTENLIGLFIVHIDPNRINLQLFRDLFTFLCYFGSLAA